MVVTSMKPIANGTRVKVYLASGRLKPATIRKSRGEPPMTECFAEFDDATTDRKWVARSQCYPRSELHNLVERLRQDADLLNRQADALETFLERDAIQNEPPLRR